MKMCSLAVSGNSSRGGAYRKARFVCYPNGFGNRSYNCSVRIQDYRPDTDTRDAYSFFSFTYTVYLLLDTMLFILQNIDNPVQAPTMKHLVRQRRKKKTSDPSFSAVYIRPRYHLFHIDQGRGA